MTRHLSNRLTTHIIYRYQQILISPNKCILRMSVCGSITLLVPSSFIMQAGRLMAKTQIHQSVKKHRKHFNRDLPGTFTINIYVGIFRYITGEELYNYCKFSTFTITTLNHRHFFEWCKGFDNCFVIFVLPYE